MAKQVHRLFTLRLFIVLLILAIALGADSGKKQGGKDGKQDKTKQKKKKDIRDFNDADMERLFMEWEEAEEDHDPDDLLEHERPQQGVDLSQIDPTNPESALKLTKKGKTLMIFVSVSGSPTKEETETITSRWESMLFNANYQLQRYPVSSDRVIFLLKDGSMAWEIKDFLVQQDKCQSVSIEGQEYYGKGSGQKVDRKAKPYGVDNKDNAKPSKQETNKKNNPEKEKAEKKTSKTSKEDSKKDKAKTVKPTKHDPKQSKTSKSDKHKKSEL